MPRSRFLKPPKESKLSASLTHQPLPVDPPQAQTPRQKASEARAVFTQRGEKSRAGESSGIDPFSTIPSCWSRLSSATPRGLAHRWMNEPAAPRPGITSFTSFYPSFERWSRRCTRRRTGRGTPAEFYKMRHMRYIIIQCELPRYSKRGRSLAFSPSAPKRIRTQPATKSRKSFIIRELLAPRCSDHLPRVRTLVRIPSLSTPRVDILSQRFLLPFSPVFLPSFLSLQFSFFGSQASFFSARPPGRCPRGHEPRRGRDFSRAVSRTMRNLACLHPRTIAPSSWE